MPLFVKCRREREERKRMGEGKDGGGAGERRGVGGRSEYRKKAGGRGSTSAPAMGGFNPACFDAHS